MESEELIFLMSRVKIGYSGARGLSNFPKLLMNRLERAVE